MSCPYQMLDKRTIRTEHDCTSCGSIFRSRTLLNSCCISIQPLIKIFYALDIKTIIAGILTRISWISKRSEMREERFQKPLQDLPLSLSSSSSSSCSQSAHIITIVHSHSIQYTVYHYYCIWGEFERMVTVFEKLFFWCSSVSLIPSLFRFFILVVGSLWYELWSKDFMLLSPKRLLVICAVAPLIVALTIWNHIGFALDDIFYPDWKLQKINRPVFIVGNARSGTTWLHRSLTSLDTNVYTTFKTWEIIFAPAIMWKRLFISMYLLDEKFGSPLYSLIDVIEKRLVGPSQLHAVGLQLAEEDEWLMAHVCLAQLLLFFFPCGSSVVTPLIMFDSQQDADFPIPHTLKCNLFNFYKDCVKRHLYTRTQLLSVSNPNDVIFVSKNPAYTLRLDTLYKTFPDCRVVCMLRDPVESIPSMVSYLAKVFGLCLYARFEFSLSCLKVYHLFSSPLIKHPNAKDLFGYCILHYQYPLGES
jgi:hypothetical protein